MRSLFLFCFLVLPSVVYAQEYRGVAAFAAMNPRYPCEQLLRTLDRVKRPAIAILWENFGDDPVCVQRFTDRYHDRPHLLQIHFTNEACRRKRSCFKNFHAEAGIGDYNRLLEGMPEATRTEVIERLNKIIAFIESVRTPNTRVVLSVGLEDNLSNLAYENLVSVIRANWPFELSRNRHTGGRSLLFADFEEKHSARGRPGRLACIANEDGNDHGKSQSKKFLKRYRACAAVFLWRGRHQGRVGKWRGKNPEDRDFRFPDRDVKTLADVLD